MAGNIDVIGILGSPRLDGNASILLDAALMGASEQGADIDRVVLNELDFVPCQECGKCENTGQCVYHDDMERIYSKLAEVQGVIIASPIFFGTLTAQTKMMIDRFQAWWAAKYVLKRPVPKIRPRQGLFICVGAIDTPKYCENAESIIKIWFVNIDVELHRSLKYHGFDEAGSIRSNTTAEIEARMAGAELVRAIRKTL